MTGSKPKAKRVLVTGATGFLGTHLCRALLARGDEVWGFNHDRAAAPLPGLRLRRVDIRQAAEVEAALQEIQPAAVCHLAARLPAPDDPADPAPSLTTGGLGTLHLARAALAAGVRSFVYCSSIDVYTEPPAYLPVDEAHPTRPATPYGIGKLMGELCLGLYARELPATVLRCAIVYGRGGKAEGAVCRFLGQAWRGEPLTVRGDGRQTNDFVYVGDVVQAHLLALDRARAGVYNIGSGQETSVAELAQAIIRLTGTAAPPVLTGTACNRPFRFALDIGRARRELGYAPRTLEAGLAACLRDYQQAGEAS